MLRSLMENANLFIFAEIGLVIFFVTFVAIVIHTLRKPKKEIDRLSRMAIDEDEHTK